VAVEPEDHIANQVVLLYKIQVVAVVVADLDIEMLIQLLRQQVMAALGALEL
jgi:hypothetical protein